MRQFLASVDQDMESMGQAGGDLVAENWTMKRRTRTNGDSSVVANKQSRHCCCFAGVVSFEGHLTIERRYDCLENYQVLWRQPRKVAQRLKNDPNLIGLFRQKSFK
jgi:hypothetical protein